MSGIARIEPDRYDDRVADAVRRIVDAAAREDGHAPLNEAAVLGLRHHGIGGGALWLAEDGDGTPVGFALASRDPATAGSAPREAVELDLVVHPRARRAGTGRALAETALGGYPDNVVTAWSHGDHPGARRLAERLGLTAARRLWVMRRPLSAEHPLPDLPAPAGVVVRTFERGRDEDAFLALNAEAFADHPEQGAMDRADLDERMAEPWFDESGFFLAEPADAPHNEANDFVDSPSLLGFHWTKVHRDTEPPVGEVYVLAVSPVASGRGLGRLLTLTGLHHLQEQGLGEVMLYVEADNAAAVALYSGLGFHHAEQDTDVQWCRPATGR